MRAKGVLGEGRIYRVPGRRFWMLDYFAPDGAGKTVRVRESSRTEDEEVAKKRLRAKVGRARVARENGESVEVPQHRRVTVGEILDDYLRDLELREKKSAHRELFRLGKEAALRASLGDAFVSSLSRETLVSYAETRRKEGRANATINRDLQGLRSALRLAHKARKVVRLPEFPEKLRERVRTGFPDPTEPEALAKVAPAWLGDMVRFAYATGWRRGELLALRWEWVDLVEGEIRIPDSKNGEGRVVPIAGELVAIMERLKGVRWISQADGSVALAETVFHDAGLEITDKRFREAWDKARKAAKLRHRLFHDFRRGAARRLTNAGVPQVVAMQITGHKTTSMFRRYSIVEKTDVARGLELVAARAAGGRRESAEVVDLTR